MSDISIGQNAAPAQNLTVLEQQTTANVVMSKALLGLVQDSLSISFTQIGEHSHRQYSASPDNPVLAPLITSRMIARENEIVSAGWQAFFTQLAENFPPDVTRELILDATKPLKDRNPLYMALADTLMIAAKFLAGTSAALAASDDAIVVGRAINNSNLSTIAAASTFIEAEAGFKEARTILDAGSNNPYGDAIGGALRQANAYLDQLKQFYGN